MTLIDYQIAAMKTAEYPEKMTGSRAALSYCALGLGEAGEVQNKIKKWLRGDYGDDKYIDKNLRDQIVMEMGDLLWYMAALCFEMETNLEEVAQKNISKLVARQERHTIKGSGDNR